MSNLRERFRWERSQEPWLEERMTRSDEEKAVHDGATRGENLVVVNGGCGEVRHAATKRMVVRGVERVSTVVRWLTTELQPRW
ncbi:hypothetical protein SESBI_40667 [Sesbania bispinosa]|nr:hypothetical protein SESBI_40667 [Sesbania bispinosa]